MVSIDRARNKSKQENKPSLNCMYTNADQLLNKIEDLKVAISGSDIDIIMITEVIPKAQKKPIPKCILNVEGYNLFLNFDCTQENLGESGIRGVAIYIKNTIESEEVKLCNVHKDHLWIEVKLKGNDKLLCGCIYRSPAKDKAMETTKQINQIFHSLNSINFSHLLICGDFNYPEIDWDTEYVNVESIKLFLQTIQSNFLHQHVCKPTRFRSGQEPSLLDLILTNEEGMINDLNHYPGIGDSDHECLVFKLKCYVDYSKEKPLKPLFDKADYNAIKNRLSCIDWDTKFQGEFHEWYNRFITELEICVKNHVPSKARNNDKKKNIYLSRKATKLKNRKRRLWSKYKNTKSAYDEQRFKRAKNELRALTRLLRKTFEANIAKDIKTAPKKFWSYVKSRTKIKDTIPSLMRPDGTRAITSKEKANTLNEYFSSVFIKEDVTNLPEKVSITDKVLENFTIDEETVLKKLKDLNPNKTPGPDGWHPVFLKNIADVIYKPLTKIFQKSLDGGQLPSEWLNACITALHKKGEKGDPGNYRPVSMTSIICKLMESIVRDKLVSFMTENELFSIYQHGFVPERNCMTNLLACMEEWCKIIEEGDQIDVIYTDFAKAFDSVPHERLLVKLKSLGIKGKVLNWIKGFLSNRKQQVRVENDYSGWKFVISGIPQGSVLGPILFVIFINDLPDVTNSTCQLFADDAKLFRGVHLRDSSGNYNLQEDINSLTNWSHKWKLPFNINKCKCLHIGMTNPCCGYKMNGKKLDRTEDEKDLGILIDNNLNFHKQTASAVKKANMSLGIIRKSFGNLDEITMIALYKALVRPHLEYGNIIWGPFNITDAKSIEKVQARATKCIPSVKHLDYEARLKKLNLPSLKHRRRRGDMISMYKLMTRKVNLDWKEYFTLSENNTRGHHLKVKKKKATKNTTLNVFSNRVVNDWNNLPREVIAANSTNAFKNQLDKFWMNDMFKI